MANPRPVRDDFDETFLGCGRKAVTPQPIDLCSSPLLVALLNAGTSHVYGDSADADELAAAMAEADGTLIAEFDGNTANQPLVRRVLDRYLAGHRMHRCASALRTRLRGSSSGELAAYLYTILCAWIGQDIVARLSAGRRWDVSLQLHMRMVETAPAVATRLGRYLAQVVPSCLVKVPFKPQAPHCLLIARDLERDGIAVNFTSTFSARQAVVAALLANVRRTNIFLGRLNQGLKAERLGEHVVLEAQRALRRLRAEGRTHTLLIAASMRDWRTFLDVAGCDAFTAPPKVLVDFLRQAERATVESRLETSYEPATRAVEGERLRRLWHVEPGLIEFLVTYGASAEYRDLSDGERLARRFEEAGFGDVFYVPARAEWEALSRSKLPDLESPLTKRLALDTLYSLLADADFEKEQAAIDGVIVSSTAAAA